VLQLKQEWGEKMILKNKKLIDDDIAQYCQSVDKLLYSIKERSVKKKGKKPVEVEKEKYITSDEDILVMS
jgi:hypothetical protein